LLAQSPDLFANLFSTFEPTRFIEPLGQVIEFLFEAGGGAFIDRLLLGLAAFGTLDV
jgi:hypothetical protein